MRLIDADALLEEIEGEFWYECDDKYNAIDVVEHAPRIEPSGDLISRADAIKAVEQEYKIDRGYMADDYTYGFNQAIQYVSDIILHDLPSADTVSRTQYQGLLNAIDKVYVEVVRCEDCRHAEHRKEMPNQIYCHRDKLSLHSYLHDDDDFCKYGERREQCD